MNKTNYAKLLCFALLALPIFIGGLFLDAKVAEAAAPTLTLKSWASMASYNASVEIYWTSTGATSCDIKRDGVAFSTATTSKEIAIKNIIKETIFTGKCTGAGGTSPEMTMKIGVLPQVVVPKYVSFAAAKTLLEYGESTTLSWEILDADKCDLKANSVLVKAGLAPKLAGYNTGPIDGYVTFELLCSKGTQTASISTAVSAKIGAGITASPMTVPYGGTATVSYWGKAREAQFTCIVTDGTWISPTENGKTIINEYGPKSPLTGSKTFTNITANKTVTIKCPFIDTFSPKNIDTNPTTRSVTITVTGTAPVKVNGACGTTVNTCLNATKFVDKADTATNYLWSCEGLNGGTVASCTLPIPPKPVVVNGACGTTVNTCLNATKFVDKPDTATQLLWSCAGLNGGATSSCALPVAVTTLPPVVITIKTNPTKIAYGASTNIIWGMNPSTATGCLITRTDAQAKDIAFLRPEFVKSEGVPSGKLYLDTTYKFTCSGKIDHKSYATTTTVLVDKPAPKVPTIVISAEQLNVELRGNTKVKWSSTDATSCSIKKDGVAWQTGISNSGVWVGTLLKDTKISATCTGLGGTSKEVTFTIKVAAESLVPKLVSYSAAKTLLEYDESTTLSWEIANAQSCKLRANSKDIKSDLPAKMTGYNTGPITGYTTFELWCVNGTKTASISTAVSSKIGAGITASPMTVPYGGTATVSYWGKARDAQFTCIVTDGTWISPTENGKTIINEYGKKSPVEGKKTFTNITADKTVKISCPFIDTFNPKNIDKNPTTRTVTIKVTGPKPAPVNGVCGTAVNTCLKATKFVDKADTTAQLLWNCEGLNGGTTASCSLTKVVAPKPTVSLTLNVNEVAKGGNVNISWTSTNSNTCKVMKDITKLGSGLKGTVSSGPINESTLAWVVCAGNGGSVSASSLIQVK